MRERKRDRLPDHGPKHAVLITLFSAKRTGRFVTNNELQKAIAEEHGDREVFINDQYLFNTVSRLREVLEEFGYTIINRKKFGYKIKSPQELEVSQ